jgi:hypothetical protein
MPKKRVNKTKDEIAEDIRHTQYVEKQKRLARLIFPVIEDMETVYDAQTVLNAVAGFIKYDLVVKEEAFKVHQVAFDTSKIDDGEVKTRILKLIDLLQVEGAKDVADLLEFMGSKLPQHLAHSHIKGPMSQIKSDEFIA